MSIDDPTQSDEGALPLLTGSYVQVQFDGGLLANTFKIPRSALYDGRYIYTAQSDNTLGRKSIQARWKTPDFVFADQGLDNPTSLVVSRIPLPIVGASIRVDKPKSPAIATGQTK